MTGPVKASENIGELSYLSGHNAAFLEELFARYRSDPAAVDPRWRAAFALLEAADTGVESGAAAPAAAPAWTAEAAHKQAAVLRLINAFRTRGHQVAKLDPLELTRRVEVPDLEFGFHGLSAADLDTVFDAGSLAAAERMTLRRIIAVLEDVYCGPIGSEYMHITDTQEKRWIQNRLEGIPARPPLSPELRRQILNRLTMAEGLERYLHTKYVGQKRFSLEGGESLIPMLYELIQRAGAAGTREIVIGMAHRGRLNVLVNTLGKSPADLFGEFEGRYSTSTQAHTGDVKYHQGFSSEIATSGGPVHLALSFNPSHLEIIDAVVEGSVRARQHRRRDKERKLVLPILIHGDAAFAGQGVVMETFNMSQARGFGNGGTLHVIINNQIGFTMSNPLDARSTLYCTEVAKMVQAPIFHVNADDPDAVLFVTQIALDFRMEFNKDVVIDLVCYRRHGHNEADEPTVTQPFMYRAIKSHPSTRTLYTKRLIEQGVIAPANAENMIMEYRDALDRGHIVAGQIVIPEKHKDMIDWTPYLGVEWTHPAQTAVPIAAVRALADRLQQLPDDFALHPRVSKILNDRAKMAAGEQRIDWGFAENLAYATLVDEGFLVRLTGQDSGRGTFFHRHAILHNQADRQTYVPLAEIGDFTVINSLLSEEAVLGFEYGYATTEPRGLVVWEAQFGDFANGAQVIIDQFISSGEAKWARLCGLTLLLPHGYEGQGPEHSSARLERFLQLCAEHNMQVCVPTTPAQMFHMLRRQVLRPYRRPLVIMSPKSLLRHKMSTSAVEELAEGRFEPVIGEIEALDAERIERVILCAGKVAFDLLEERTGRGLENIAIIRVEQLHPFPRDRLMQQLQRYGHATEIVWCQEEPKNQGSWTYIRDLLRECVTPQQRLFYAGRPASPAPAAGYYQLHIEQQSALIDEALTLHAAAGGEAMAQRLQAHGS